MPSEQLKPLLDAIEPIAAYCARTPQPNKHAEQCAALINEVGAYAEAVEAESKAREAQPDWQSIAAQVVRVVEFQPRTNPLLLRCNRLLESPSIQQRGAMPLAERMYLATANSHNLGFPDFLR